MHTALPIGPCPPELRNRWRHARCHVVVRSSDHEAAWQRHAPHRAPAGPWQKSKRKSLQHAAVRCQAAATVESCPNQLKVMIAGAPAAGKGTQCERLVEKYGLVHVSVGDLLRAEVAAGTPAGKRAAQFMDSGNLVPNEVVVEMVTHRLSQGDVRQHGWLLDGYPRSGAQAEAIEQQGIRPDVFILITVPDDILVERVTGRRMDPDTGIIYHVKFKPPPKHVVDRLVQRSDDTEEKVLTRIATHNDNVDAVLGYYRDIIVEVDGTRSMDTVFADIQEALHRVTQQHQKVVAA